MMKLRPLLFTSLACLTLVASHASPSTGGTANLSGIVSLDAVTPPGPATLTTGQSQVTLKVTVLCDVPAGSVCQVGFDFIAADGSRVQRGVGFGRSVGAGTHTVKIGGATRPDFTGQTIGVHVALYRNGTSQELTGTDFREKELKYTWVAP
jgi:hypothetical protein